MKRNPSRVGGPTTLTEADDLDTAFDALSDADCRRILATVDEPMTTSEIADDCDIALSTAYRKVERLSETPLLTEGVRFDPDGDHAAEYSRGVTDATVELTDAGVRLTVESEAIDAIGTAFDTPEISAD
ncbi:ArsR family transcriptional regulator [Halorubrum sp. 48-1-W]|uniref:winged helix-turn-helix domain-containing protein n=1 Tax=Halorubrum sp. 48-1-W TaxID=2249761 RepID=UPI000DCE2965|nr:helix-turn-helix domain-containing protein [Halorubrum sp. 48-1-W]RAW45089.1 ArsR family transcriptional regulator [Halorubrum sp. 48-1-W]